MPHLLCSECAIVIKSVHDSVCAQLNWSAFIFTLSDKLLDLSAQTSVCPTVSQIKKGLTATDCIFYTSPLESRIGIWDVKSSREKKLTQEIVTASSLTAPSWELQCNDMLNVKPLLCFTLTDGLVICPPFQNKYFNWKEDCRLLSYTEVHHWPLAWPECFVSLAVKLHL